MLGGKIYTKDFSDRPTRDPCEGSELDSSILSHWEFTKEFEFSKHCDPKKKRKIRIDEEVLGLGQEESKKEFKEITETQETTERGGIIISNNSV